ncbi:MAG: hypothetical protein OXU98_05130 [Gammaproteobacteria bacterium]|nr:hypothetical protein [Gammaproteobacteria bacterium]
MATLKEQVIRTAISILKRKPKGLRNKDLCQQIAKKKPELNPNTIQGGVWNIHNESREVDKVEGLFKHAKYQSGNLGRADSKATRGERIVQEAIRLLEGSPDGLRYTVLCQKIAEGDSALKIHTIRGAIHDIQTKRAEIEKVERGLFRHIKYQDDKSTPEIISINGSKEEDFYPSFAEWLVGEVEDATHAVALGGNVFGGRWGTPDVIGKKEPHPFDVVKGGTEIVSAEIKSDTSQLITAFGQACAYKLFSHKCYLVVPKNSSEADKKRLDSLCQLFGIGLVLFNADNADNPNYQIRARPQKHEPDLFYTNENVKKVEKLWSQNK